jgi:U2-associated protein SR140
MPDELKGKSFPDVSAKLSALPKKSLFERQKAEAEAKRIREQAETDAVLEDFVKSFDDEAPTGPPPSDGRLNTLGGKGGGFGAPSKRHFTGSTSRSSGPGTLGPPPPSLSRKRPHEGFFPALHRDQPGFEGANMSSGPASAFGSSEVNRAAEEAERAAAKPTLYLASLPPGTSPSVIKALMPSVLTVDDIKILRPPGQNTTDKRSSAAIVILASDTAASDIDTTVSTLQNKYLGWGYYLNLSRHLSSAAINSKMPLPVGISSASSLPFGAKTIQPNIGGSLSRAPPPGPHQGGFAPPSSYGPNPGRSGPTTVVEVRVPSDINQLRLIHLTLEHLLNHGPQFEALLMSRPEVQKDEKWAWLWDARSTGGVYYRWKLWQIITNPRSEKTKAHQPVTIFEGGPTWMPPENDLKFEYTTRLEDFVSDEDYNSSDEENSDGEDERRNRGGAPPEGVDAYGDGLGYLNPLKKAKLTHLLARLPNHQAKLRRGDVARLTAFAMEHVESGAAEVVDMTVLNVLNPLVYTGANIDREIEKESASTTEPSDPSAEGQDDLASKESSETTFEDKENSASKKTFDPSGSKLVGLFVISDILSAACHSGVRHSWRYRHLFENAFRSQKVFEHLGRLDKDLNWGRMKARKWKTSVGYLLELWEGMNCFTQSSQEYFVGVLEKPPLTEAESQKENKKADAEKAAAAFAKSKNRWKTVDDDGLGGKFDPTRPASDGKQPAQSTFTEDESMSDIDGVVMEDSDHEMEDDEGKPVDKVQQLPTGNEDTQMQSPQQPTHSSDKPEESAGQQESETRRRKPRPKAEDMFASDSE